MSFGKQLIDLREKNGFTRKDLAEKIEIPYTTLRNYETDVREPGHKFLIQISSLFNVSVDYLLGLKKEDTGQSSIIKESANNRSSITSIFDLADNIFPLQTKKIPLLGEIACGEPIYAVEDYGSYVTCGVDINADFCLVAKGDSMINARINDGDIVFIKEQPDVYDGEIAAVIIDDEATLKRVYKDNLSVTLQAENPKYRPIIITENDCKNVRILGKAVAFQSNIR